jgi:hypothetical protein
MARPTKLTPHLQETLVAALRAGAWFSDACRIAGVKKSTAYEWHRRGRGEDPRPPTPAHVAFAKAVDAALADRGTVSANGQLDEFAAEAPRGTQRHESDFSLRANHGEPELNEGNLRPQHSPALSSTSPIADAFAAQPRPATASQKSNSSGPGETGETPEKGESPDVADPEWKRWERLKRRISAGAPEDPFADDAGLRRLQGKSGISEDAVAQVAQPKKAGSPAARPDTVETGGPEDET